MKRLAAVTAVGAAGFIAFHELGRRWGATREELRGPIAGDGIVSRAKRQTTHAITIKAAAKDVWPWLVQMGYHRAGWYTYSWVDRYLWNIDNPSASRIIPELQNLSVGDIVPDGESGTAFYRVVALDPPRTLVLHSTSHVPQPLRGRMTVDWTWAYELHELDPTTTRLLLRVRATFAPRWVRLLYDGMIVPSDFVMARSMLRGIARRAEGRLSRTDVDDDARRNGVKDGTTSSGIDGWSEGGLDPIIETAMAGHSVARSVSLVAAWWANN